MIHSSDNYLWVFNQPWRIHSHSIAEFPADVVEWVYVRIIKYIVHLSVAQ